VRVVEGWAGRGYGSQFLPRVGQEVLVDFLDGDPEHPVIVGRLYNADHGSTNLPFATDKMTAAQPTTLGDLLQSTVDNLAYSGIRTQSIPTTDASGKPLSKGFHLLRFNDTRNGEQLLMRSQWRMDLTALGNYYDTTYGSRHVSIGSFDAKDPFKCVGELRTKIYKQYDLHVGDPRDSSSGSLHALTEGNFDLHVKKGTNLALDGGCSISVGDKGTLSMHAGSIVIDATKKITLSVGGASIVIVPGQIFIAPLDDLKISGPGDAPVPAAAHEPNPPDRADLGYELKPIRDPKKDDT
jgi:type VI secretion system secreted protein VgrG